jgi:hypothetical protein
MLYLASQRTTPGGSLCFKVLIKKIIPREMGQND